MNSKDRRELVELLRKHEGLSKQAALRAVSESAPDSLEAALVKLRMVDLESSGQLVLPVPAPSVAAAEAGSLQSRPKKVPYTLLLPPAMLEALKALSDDDGAPVSHHIRQAIKGYLKR